MSDLRNYLNKQLQDSEFKAEYDASRAELEIMRAVISARMDAKLTQKELAERSGVRQSNISRIENGTSVPNIATLCALAEGMNKRLVISFE